MGLSVTVLGCDGSFAGPEGACSGYLVRSASTSVWLDAGPGTFANLQRHLDLAAVDAIVLSHEHPDHWVELPVVRNAARYMLGLEGIALFSTARTLELAAAISTELSPTFVPTVLTDGSDVTIGDQRWRFERTDHPVETLACRVEHDGASLFYSSDTGPAWSATGLATTADLALIEASLDEGRSGTVQHLTASDAGLRAAEAGVARLVLTHLEPGCDREARRAAAAAHYDGPIELAAIDERFTT